MGGLGSGYPRGMHRKNTVEQSLHLDAAWFDLRRLLVNRRTGNIVWTDPRNGMKMAGADLAIDLQTPHKPAIFIGFKIAELGIVRTQKIPLVSCRPFYGGRRWFFICPLCGEEGRTPHRVRKLYLPLGEGTNFGCRICHDLTYDSCQDSHRFDRLFLDMAREVYGSHGNDEMMLAKHIRRGLVGRSF